MWKYRRWYLNDHFCQSRELFFELSFKTHMIKNSSCHTIFVMTSPGTNAKRVFMWHLGHIQSSLVTFSYKHHIFSAQPHLCIKLGETDAVLYKYALYKLYFVMYWKKVWIKNRYLRFNQSNRNLHHIPFLSLQVHGMLSIMHKHLDSIYRFKCNFMRTIRLKVGKQ